MTAPVLGIPRISSRHPVQDLLHISTIRLHAMAMARAHGFTAEAIERVGAVADEMAANIARHVGLGDIILRAVGDNASGCIEILALDKGPGIGDIRRALRENDEKMSAGGSANGLPGVRKIADLFDIYSPPGRGTAVVAHVGAAISQSECCACGESAARGNMGLICVPVHGEEECGDTWAVEMLPGGQAAVIVDGLGHGPDAAVAAQAAMAVFREKSAESHEDVFAAMDTALHATRGAAMSITVLDPAKRNARFCGIGNVEGRIVTTSANRHLLPQNGIVGHNMPRVQYADAPWPADGRLVMHSDGISSRWRAEHYPGILARHPALLAGVLFRDCARARDDATVLVVRDPQPAPPA